MRARRTVSWPPSSRVTWPVVTGCASVPPALQRAGDVELRLAVADAQRVVQADADGQGHALGQRLAAPQRGELPVEPVERLLAVVELRGVVGLGEADLAAHRVAVRVARDADRARGARAEALGVVDRDALRLELQLPGAHDVRAERHSAAQHDPAVARGGRGVERGAVAEQPQLALHLAGREGQRLERHPPVVDPDRALEPHAPRVQARAHVDAGGSGDRRVLHERREHAQVDRSGEPGGARRQPAQEPGLGAPFERAERAREPQWRLREAAVLERPLRGRVERDRALGRRCLEPGDGAPGPQRVRRRRGGLEVARERREERRCVGTARGPCEAVVLQAREIEVRGLEVQARGLARPRGRSGRLPLAVTRPPSARASSRRTRARSPSSWTTAFASVTRRAP